MKEIYKIFKSENSLLRQQSLHIMCASFEKRCLAYPEFLKDQNLSANEHIFYCIDLPNENVCGFLQELKEENKKIIKQYLRSILFEPFGTIKKGIEELFPPINIYLDISGLPRQYIFQILKVIYEKLEKNCNIRIFCIYTYPKDYAENPLQEPASEIEYIFHSADYFSKKKISLIIMPGFDIEYTHVGITHVWSISGYKPEIFWFIPFPGREYIFYERVLESHFHLLKESRESNIILYPQEEIKLGFNKLSKQIESLEDPILIMPIGCRIICVSVFFSVITAIKKGRKIDIIFPKTSVYTSLRSDLYVTPLIEEIPIKYFLKAVGIRPHHN